MPLFNPDTLLKYTRPRNPLPSGENHLDYQDSVIQHLDFGDQSTHGLHDVRQSSSHMVTPTRAALSLSLSSSAVVSHNLLHKCNNSLAYIRWVDLCYLVKHLRPHSNDRLSAESRVSPLRKTPLAHSALEFNKALADLEVWLLDVSASGVFFIVMLCPRLLRC